MMNIDAEGLFKQLDSRPKSLLEFVEQNRLKNMQNEQNEMILRKQRRQEDFDMKSDPLELAKLEFQNMSEQDKFVENELLQGSIELQPFIDAKDSQSVMQSLQMRRNKLAQAGLRTDEIDNAIQLAQQGDFDTLKQLTGSQIQAGRAIGLLQDNSQNLPAALQLADALAEARASGNKQRVRDILTMTKAEKLPVGTTYNDDGTISNVSGVEDSIGGQAYAEKFGSSQGALPAEQEKQNMRVGAENEIDRNKSLAPAVQKQIKETTDIINTTNRSIDRGIALYDKIDNGTLNLGLAKNAINNAKNGLGISTEESRSLDELQTYVNELANNIQLMAKGTQTEGDALRAKNIILSGTADEAIVKERLAYLIKINSDLVQEQELALDTQYRQNNKSPDAYKPQTTQQQPQERIRTYNPQTGNFE